MEFHWALYWWFQSKVQSRVRNKWGENCANQTRHIINQPNALDISFHKNKMFGSLLRLYFKWFFCHVWKKYVKFIYYEYSKACKDWQSYVFCCFNNYRNGDFGNFKRRWKLYVWLKDTYGYGLVKYCYLNDVVYFSKFLLTTGCQTILNLCPLLFLQIIVDYVF